jgi:RND family efflux transporter MFP subunit
VRTIKVETRTRPVTEEVMGTVRARVRAGLEAKLSGRIEELRVVAGQTVQEGEVIARLDARESQARLDQALALREQAANELKRKSTLLEAKAITQSEYDGALASFRVTEAVVKEAETQRGHTIITAPFSGVITRKLAEAGDQAIPGRTLVELEKPSDLRLEANVPESLLERVPMGARLPVHLATARLSLTGTVSEVAPVADSSSRTFLVKLDLPATNGVRAGQFGRVTVPVGETTSLRLPASALVLRGQLEIVFVVDGHTARLRLVKTGRKIGEDYELVAGLNGGELIVTEGAGQLQDGQPLELKP